MCAEEDGTENRRMAVTFHKIDMQAWERKKRYEHYAEAVPCTYSMTVALDVTKLLCGVREKELPFFPWSYMGLHGRSTGMRNFGWPRMKWGMWDITATAIPVIRFSIRRQKASRRFGRHTMLRLRCFWRGIGRIWRGTGMLRSFQSRPQAKTCSTCPAFPGRALQAST